MSQLVLTPVGTLSVFGFKTPVPYPFGTERTGYVVTDMDTAIQAAPRRALMCLSPCSTIPSGETPLSNDYGISTPASPEGYTARPQSQSLGVVAKLQVLLKEADENLGAVVMELEKHLC